MEISFPFEIYYTIISLQHLWFYDAHKFGFIFGYGFINHCRYVGWSPHEFHDGGMKKKTIFVVGKTLTNHEDSLFRAVGTHC